MSGTWRSHSDAVTSHLAYMVAVSGPTEAGDLDAALHARRSILHLASNVLFDASMLPRYGRPNADDPQLHSDSVAHLARLLQNRDYPYPRRSLTDVLSEEPHNERGTLWRALGRDAALAHYEWSRINSNDPRLKVAASAAIHEVAQFTTAVTWLDDDLSSSFRVAGRGDVAELLLEDSARLRPIAASVVALGTAEPLPGLPDVGPAAARAAIVVRHEAAVAPAIDRLAHLLESAEHVGPEQVQETYRVLGSLVGRAAAVLETTEGVRLPYAGAGDRAVDGNSTLLGGLHEHSSLLQFAGRSPGRVRTTMPTDSVVAVQTDMIRTFASMRGGHGIPPGWLASPGRIREYVVRLARSSTRAASALHETVAGSLSHGTWVVPAGEKAPFKFIWTPSSAQHADPTDLDAPTLLKTSARAEGHATRLAEGLSRAVAGSPARESPPPQHAPAAGLLASALRAASRRSALSSTGPTTTEKRLGR